MTPGSSCDGPLIPTKGSHGNWLVAMSQAAKRRTASWRVRTVPGAEPVSSSSAIQVCSDILAMGTALVVLHHRS